MTDLVNQESEDLLPFCLSLYLKQALLRHIPILSFSAQAVLLLPRRLNQKASVSKHLISTNTWPLRKRPQLSTPKPEVR